MKRIRFPGAAALALAALLPTCGPAMAQLVDRVKAPNAANEGIAKSLEQQVGADRGDWIHAGVVVVHHRARSVSRDPPRAGSSSSASSRSTEGQGSLANNGHGDIGTNLAIGAGMADSCAACHGRPRGAAGAGGDVATRPDSRDAPHLFGLGLKEMLADEMTTDLRDLRSQALAAARQAERADPRSR